MGRLYVALITRAEPCPCCGRSPFRTGEVCVVEEYLPGLYWRLPDMAKLHKWPVGFRLVPLPRPLARALLRRLARHRGG